MSYSGWRVVFCPSCATDRAVKKGRCIQCGSKVKLPAAGGFNAEPTTGAYSGKQRDSKQEAYREPVLQALANAGRITDLVLTPSSYSLEVYGTAAVENLLTQIREVDWEAIKKAAQDVERSRQKIGGYTPDFQYRDHTGALVVEDVKGWKVSRDFPLRKKLMVACHNVDVQMIREQRGVQQYARGTGVKGKGVGARFKGNGA